MKREICSSHEHPPGLPFVVAKLELALKRLVKRSDMESVMAVAEITREIERLRSEVRSNRKRNRGVD